MEFGEDVEAVVVKWFGRLKKCFCDAGMAIGRMSKSEDKGKEKDESEFWLMRSFSNSF